LASSAYRASGACFEREPAAPARAAAETLVWPVVTALEFPVDGALEDRSPLNPFAINSRSAWSAGITVIFSDMFAVSVAGVQAANATTAIPMKSEFLTYTTILLLVAK
jgi:hypothetical protein